MTTLKKFFEQIASDKYIPTDQEFCTTVTDVISTEIQRYSNSNINTSEYSHSVYTRVLLGIIKNGRYDLYQKMDRILDQHHIPFSKKSLNLNTIIELSRIGVARKHKSHPEFPYETILENYLSILMQFLEKHCMHERIPTDVIEFASTNMEFPPFDENDHDALGVLGPIKQITRILLNHNQLFDEINHKDIFNDAPLEAAIALSLENTCQRDTNGAGPADDSDSETAPLIDKNKKTSGNTKHIDENNALPSKWLLLLARHQLKILSMALMIAATIIACTLKLSAVIMFTVIIPMLVLPAILFLGSCAATELTDSSKLNQDRDENFNLNDYPLF